MSDPDRDALAKLEEPLPELRESEKLLATAWFLADHAKEIRDLRARLALLNCAAFMVQRAQAIDKERLQ